MLAEALEFSKLEPDEKGKLRKFKDKEQAKTGKKLLKLYAGTYEKEDEDYIESTGAHMSDLVLHKKAVM